MRVAFFHDEDRRLPRLRGELEARGHRVIVVGPDASHRFLVHLFGEERPDIIHSLGRGPTALLVATWWGRRLRERGTRRVSDVRGVPFVDDIVDGSLPAPFLEAAYLRVLGLR